MLPSDPTARKALPICTGVLDYFPDALAAVAACSLEGNNQHNPGQPLALGAPQEHGPRRLHSQTLDRARNDGHGWYPTFC